MKKVYASLLGLIALGLTTFCYAAPPPRFIGEDLGVLPGDAQSIALGVNAAGAVVGVSFGQQGEPRAFFWDPSTQEMQSLTTSGNTGYAFALSGGPTTFAVGFEDTADGPHAVVWIGPPSAPVQIDAAGSTAQGVNDSGTIVGDYRGQAAIWSWNGSVYQRESIEFLPGQDQSYATDIDSGGIVVGYGYDADFIRGAFLRLPNGSVVALPPLESDVESQATAVSEVFVDGDVEYVTAVGVSIDTSGTDRGVRWTANVATGAVSAPELLALQFASGISDAGDIAGTAGKAHGPQHAAVLRGSSYLQLKSPAGSKGSAAYAIAGSVGAATYVAGVAYGKNAWGHAVRWELPSP